MKTEPDVFSIDQLKKDKTTWWTGVRNYQARNFMKEMSVGDEVLFYHSSCEIPGVVGVAKVSKRAAPDELQFDKKSEYFDAKATKDKPTWYCVQVQFAKKFANPISLDDLRKQKNLSEMLVLRKGQRLSVQPVSQAHFEIVQSLGNS